MNPRSRRSVCAARIAALTVVVAAVWLVDGPARADSCFDASDEARTLLASRHLIDARTRLRLCAASDCDETVRALCDERLAEVTARLSTIIFDVKDPEGQDLTDVALTIDGEPHAGGARGEEITLDPGPHVFVLSVAGAPSVERRLVLAERDKGRRDHVVLGTARAVAAPGQLPPPDLAARAAPSAWRTAGWITLGAAAVALGIGAAYGITAIGKNDDARCDASNVCDDPRSRHGARVAANVSTVSILAGAALTAGGVALVLFAPRAPASHRASEAMRVALTSFASGASAGLGVSRSW